MELELLSVIPAKKKQFASKGIYTVEDLLSFMPRKYKDYSRITGILPKDQVSCIRVHVESVESKNAGKMPFVTAVCTELESGKRVNVLWFHMQWIYQQIRGYIGRDVVAIGKMEFNERYNSYSMIQPDAFDYESCLGIYPVYKSIAGMSTDYVLNKISAALQIGLDESEILPEDIVKREGELPMPEALRRVHQPQTMEEAAEGQNRILLNDLLYFSLHNELNKANISAGSQFNIKTLKLLKAIQSSLPYTLTDDQQTAISSMVEDARNGRRLHALLQGDVGCGKTIVSALLAAAFIGSGYQAVIMAPTQVLAKQHLESMGELFAPHGVTVAYLDSSLKKKERTTALEQIRTGKAQLVIGTHACIAKDVVFHNLALAIVDEEHKFGVKQRAAIADKAAAGVHSVTMSATPIPRSLAQVIYGDNIQLHTIKTMPNGRKPIITGIAKDQNRVFKFVLSQIKKGHQIYVVCPLIDQSEATPDVQSVDSVSDLYRRALAPYGVRIATLTGRDSKADTESTIKAFHDRKIDILIATTVIEVGVNVPNATVMVVINAERFGLSGLHQLRGRVGRGADQAYCVLQSTSTDEKALQRLQIMCDSTNGFEIAEADLKLRGAGDFLGTQQSGDNKYIALMLANPDRYKTAVRIARELIDRGMDCCKLTQKVEKERTSQEYEEKDG